jgi:levanase/fructan beta-fructosidase
MVLAHSGTGQADVLGNIERKSWTWGSDLSGGQNEGLPSGITGWEVPDMFELPIQGTKATN